MKETKYHQLCLWDPEDRILRQDFNRDNKTIDAALAALSSGKLGRVELIDERATTGPTTAFAPALWNVDWKDWEFFAVYAELPDDPSRFVTCTLGDTEFYRIEKHSTLALFWPGHDPSRQVKALLLSQAQSGLYVLDLTYQDFTEVDFYFDERSDIIFRTYGIR